MAKEIRIMEKFYYWAVREWGEEGKIWKIGRMREWKNNGEEE